MSPPTPNGLPPPPPSPPLPQPPHGVFRPPIPHFSPPPEEKDKEKERDAPPELPHERTGMIPLGEVVRRLGQKVWEDLGNLVEVLPAKGDADRKLSIRDFGSQARKQVVKTLVLTRWARDAPIIQRCQDVKAFLQAQNTQFRDTVDKLGGIRMSLVPARSRNWDLLTAIDVLSTGTYLRLPKVIKEFTPAPPLSPPEAIRILREMDHVLRYRLRMGEVVPVEMGRYRISDGRAHFHVPGLFDCALTTSPSPTSPTQPPPPWYLLSLTFPLSARDPTRIFSRFPKTLDGPLREQIIEMGNRVLAGPGAGTGAGGAGAGAGAGMGVGAGKKKGAGGAGGRRVGWVDAPLVRVYNFLQMFALSYQLEILLYQATQLVRELGWRGWLRVESGRDRRRVTGMYWEKPRPPPPQGHPPWPPSQSRIFGGTITLSLEPKPEEGGRGARERVLGALEERLKGGWSLMVGEGSGGGAEAGRGKRQEVLVRTRDKVEGMRLRVMWEPAGVWMGVQAGSAGIRGEEFDVDPSNLDFEAILSGLIVKHANALMALFFRQLRTLPVPSALFTDSELSLLPNSQGLLEIHAHLRPSETTVLKLDVRTGTFVLREEGGMASRAREALGKLLERGLNERVPVVWDVLCKAKFHIVLDELEKKAAGLRTSVTRAALVRAQDLPMFGPTARFFLYIALASFPSHYLVLVLADSGLQYAMLKVQLLNPDTAPEFQALECAWLDVRRISGSSPPPTRWTISAPALADVYAFCRARVAHAELEQQLRDVSIASTSAFDSPSSGLSQIPTLPFASPHLEQQVPTIRIESSAFLGAMAADASTMSADAWCAYIAFRAINWTRLSGTVGVVAAVALRPEFFVPLADEKSTEGEYAGVKVKLDSRSGVISFCLEDVRGAIVAFLKAWEGVSKAVSVAREVRAMSREPRYAGVQLLSFTLSSVSLMYQTSFSLTISSHQSTSLMFAYHGTPGRRNPHEEGVEQYSKVFEESGPRRLIEILRDTLPLLIEFDQLDAAPANNFRWYLREADWLRALYGDSKHALDFRLLTGSRLLVVDGALSLFTPYGKSMVDSVPAPQPAPHASEKNLVGSLVGFEPIQGLPALLLDVTRTVAQERARVGHLPSGNNKTPEVVPLDAGLLCQQSAIRTVVRALHEGMLKLQESR